MHLTLFFQLACSSPSPSPYHSEGTKVGDCTDRADNDADGLFDCDDQGCFGSPDCVAPPQEPATEPSEPSQSTSEGIDSVPQEDCTDGEDNDYDAFVDCQDPNCFDHQECSNQVSTEYFCADREDNDSDGYVDCEDSDCAEDHYCR